MFVTRAPKEKVELKPMVSTPKFNNPLEAPPSFTALELYQEMMNPQVQSKNITSAMASADKSPNRLQDTWVWNGRPDWDQVEAAAEMLVAGEVRGW
jgi:hypothetical protein